MGLQDLEAIASTSSRNAKIAILKEQQYCNFTKDILYYTYHPLKHYGIRQIPWKGKGSETLRLQWQTSTTCWTKLLDNLANGSLSGDAAKARVKAFIESLTYEEAELFKKILKKDLRAGISISSINKAFDYDFIPVFGAMLAKKYVGSLKGPVYMSLKLDGLRAIYKDEVLYTRNGHKIHGVQHITEALRLGGIDSADGELMIPGLHFQESSGLIRSHARTPEAVFYMFDVPSHPGEFSKRLKHMKELSTNFGQEENYPIEFVKHVITSSEQKVLDTYNKALIAGYEGLVLKTPHHKYQTKRSADWQKLKEVLDADLPVIGFFEGQGKYEGSLGGIIVDNAGVAVKVGGGFSDSERAEIWANQEKYKGRIAEVLYHEETPDRSLRHPRFIRFRYDK